MGSGVLMDNKILIFVGLLLLGIGGLLPVTHANSVTISPNTLSNVIVGQPITLTSDAVGFSNPSYAWTVNSLATCPGFSGYASSNSLTYTPNSATPDCAFDLTVTDTVVSAGDNGDSSASFSATLPAVYSEYLCTAAAYMGFASQSWTVDEAYGWASTGHQSANTCSASQNSAGFFAIAEAGTSNTATVLASGADTSGGAYQVSYPIVDEYQQTVILLSGIQYSLTSVSVSPSTGSCVLVENEEDHGYAAIYACSGQSAAGSPYTVTVTPSRSDSSYKANYVIYAFNSLSASAAATSNAISANSVPTPTLAAGSNSIYLGQPATFTATVPSGGFGPFTVNLMYDGNVVGTNTIDSPGGSATLSFTPSSTGTLSFNAVATDTGATNAPAFGSNSLAIVVNQAPARHSGGPSYSTVSLSDDINSSLASNSPVFDAFVIDPLTGQAVSAYHYYQDQLPAIARLQSSDELNISFACNVSVGPAEYAYAGTAYGLGAGRAAQCGRNYTVYGSSYEALYSLSSSQLQSTTTTTPATTTALPTTTIEATTTTPPNSTYPTTTAQPMTTQATTTVPATPQSGGYGGWYAAAAAVLIIVAAAALAYRMRRGARGGRGK